MSQNKIIINQISINPASVARLLGIVAFILILTSVGVHLLSYFTNLAEHKFYHKLISKFDVDIEQNIPSFFSTLLLLFATLLLAIITLLERNRSASHVSQWAILTFGLLFMTTEEIVSIHEMFAGPIRMLLGNNNLGLFYYAWVIPYFLLAVLFALFLVRFFLNLDSKTRLYVFYCSSPLYGWSSWF